MELHGILGNKFFHHKIKSKLLSWAMSTKVAMEDDYLTSVCCWSSKSIAKYITSIFYQIRHCLSHVKLYLTSNFSSDTRKDPNIYFYSKQKYMRNTSSFPIVILHSILFQIWIMLLWFYDYELERHNQTYLNFILYNPL